MVYLTSWATIGQWGGNRWCERGGRWSEGLQRLVKEGRLGGKAGWDYRHKRINWCERVVIAFLALKRLSPKRTTDDETEAIEELVAMTMLLGTFLSRAWIFFPKWEFVFFIAHRLLLRMGGSHWAPTCNHNLCFWQFFRSESHISLSTLEIRDHNFTFLFLLSKFEIRISNFSFYEFTFLTLVNAILWPADISTKELHLDSRYWSYAWGSHGLSAQRVWIEEGPRSRGPTSP